MFTNKDNSNHGCNQKIFQGGHPFQGGGANPCVGIIYWTKTNTYKGKFGLHGGQGTPLPPPPRDTHEA